MQTLIEATELPLNKIFCNDFSFEIPEYQRPYAWTTEETSELLDDVKTAMSNSTEESYFLGSMVLAKLPNDTKAEVVDGQQRLTTLTILFSVLRDLTDSRQSKDELDDFVLDKGSELKGTQDRFRLGIRDRDRGFFEEHILKRDAVNHTVEKYSNNDTKAISEDSRRQIIENTKWLWLTLKNSWTNEQRRELSLFLSTQCFLVVVTTVSAESAHRIFSVLNGRGLDLSPVDTLKAEVIGSQSGYDRTEATETWENIEDEIGRENFQDLFSHVYMIKQMRPHRGGLTKVIVIIFSQSIQPLHL